MTDFLISLCVVGFYISSCFMWYYTGKLKGGDEVWKILEKKYKE